MNPNFAQLAPKTMISPELDQISPEGQKLVIYVEALCDSLKTAWQRRLIEGSQMRKIAVECQKCIEAIDVQHLLIGEGIDDTVLYFLEKLNRDLNWLPASEIMEI